MGTRINPPPAPMRVPNAPINIPNGKSHKYSTGMSRLIFSFQLKFRETRLRTHICQSKRTRGIEEFLAAARRRQTITLFPKTTRPSEKEGIKAFPVPESRKVCWRFCSSTETCSVPTQSVKPLRVAITHRIFVFFGKPSVFVQFFELRLARFVVDLVRKVRREDERLVADDTHCEGQGQFVAFNTDEYPILVDMPPHVIRYRFVFAQLQKAPMWIVLHMAVPGTLEALETIDEPTGTGLHKAEADFWILIENAIKENAREVDHLAKRMPQGVNRGVRAHVIQPHVIVDPAVDADTACESIRFFVDRPVALVPQLVLLTHGTRARQHRATKPELFDDAA